MTFPAPIRGAASTSLCGPYIYTRKIGSNDENVSNQ